ncbi:MAG: LptM family lipoprotein [Bacillota bacterium]
MKKVFVCLFVLLSIFMLAGCMTEEEKEIDAVFDSINKDIAGTSIVPSNWKYVDSLFPSGGEMIICNEKHFFYIEKDIYDEYKYYWLEDVDDSDYRDGLNSELRTVGNKVFYDINMSNLGELSDGDYRGVSTTPDARYYLITIYDNVLYYNDVSEIGEDAYGISPVFDTSEANTIKEYLAHQENGKWIYEEIKDQ